LIVVIVIIHMFGTSTNRKKAKQWVAAHVPVLQKEFALVGFGGRKPPTAEEVENAGLAKSMANDTLELPVDLLKEKSPQEFTTYATGRQNVAFLDVNLTLMKRYSPLSMIAEYGMSLFFESMPAPVEQMEAILYPFDGREALTVPGQAPGAHELRKDTKSGFDGFVWAIVNKETMKQLRDEYDCFPLVIHTSYLVNLCSQLDDVRANSIKAFHGEVERALALGAEYLVLPSLKAGINYTYIKRNNLSNPSLHFIDVPEHKVFGFLQYQYRDRFSVQANTEYNSTRYSTSFLPNVRVHTRQQEKQHLDSESGIAVALCRLRREQKRSRDDLHGERNPCPRQQP